MTTYRTISDTEIAVDAPLTQQLMQALKDNDTATAEGSAGAPRIQHVALEGCDGTPSAGDYVINSATIFSETQGNDDQVLFKFRKAGAYKIGIYLVAGEGVGSNFDVTANVYKSTDNGSSYGSSLYNVTADASSANTTNDADYDITVTANDWAKIAVTTTTGRFRLAVIIGVADENAIFGVDCIRINNFS